MNFVCSVVIYGIFTLAD